jgi:hypothetical protein
MSVGHATSLVSAVSSHARPTVRRLRSLTLVAATVAVAAIAIALVTGARTQAALTKVDARYGQPARGSLLLGVVGPDPVGFDRLTGKHHALHVMFANWSGDVAGIVRNEHAAGRLPVLSLSSSVAPAEIARGAEDARYVTLATALNGVDEDLWVRILPEMNGAWNAWCAFDESGRSRGPSYATPEFVRAFRRIALILRGGPVRAINGKLRAARLPPLRSGDIPRSGRVGIVWNPQGHGTPYIDANGPSAYWPGPAYVDIVADDLYSDSGEPSWQGMDTLYAYPKPFLVAEWGLKAEDNVIFATRMFEWIRNHPRMIGLVYFNKGWSGGSDIFELRTKPRSLAVYRRAIRNARFLAKLP